MSYSDNYQKIKWSAEQVTIHKYDKKLQKGLAGSLQKTGSPDLVVPTDFGWESMEIDSRSLQEN